MGTLTLWIVFNAGVAVLLFLDLGIFNRRAHVIGFREAGIESAAWVALSLSFGLWIYFSHGRGAGLEFFSGYVIEKSLSVDNIFIFLLIFQFFRVDARYQHRLLFWGVLGALVMRGVMIGLGTILIHKFGWILYLFGAFLLYAGFRLFRTGHSVNAAKNPVLRWLERILPMSKVGSGQKLFMREGRRWLATPLFLVVIVLETTDLVFAVDSIPAVFGVTHDPFLVYTSNVCAILGLRAFYFLLAGIMPYFKFLDEGLAVVLMFIGGKMLADPWIHISTGLSLAVVASIIVAAMLISIIAVKLRKKSNKPQAPPVQTPTISTGAATDIHKLASTESKERLAAAGHLFRDGTERILDWLDHLLKDKDFRSLLVEEKYTGPHVEGILSPNLTVGIAVQPETFTRIRAANGSPALADAPADQDVFEFELEFEGHLSEYIRLDILTTKTPGGSGAIARFLEKFGEAIQQVEVDVTDVDRATEILVTRFQIEPVYPATRAGANGTRVNFFLVTASGGKKVLVELVEQPK